MNIKPKSSPRPNELLPEVSAQPVSQNIVSQHSPTTRIKPIIQSTGKRLQSSTENKTVRPTRWIKEAVRIHKKGRELWNETRAVSSWVTPTNAFLMRQLIVASRLGSTSFFWWRSRDDIETSKWDIKVLVVIYEFSTSKSIHSFAFLALFSNKWLHIRPTVLR